MYFTGLIAENFLSIGNLTMDLAKRGLLVIMGENLDDPSAASNGSGKSACLEAIYWCLYGKTLRGIKYADGVINRRFRKNCRVQVSLNIREGMLEIERFRKHKTGKNGLHVRLNGVDKHASDPRTTQRTLNGLLGMDADMFARLVVIGQGFSQRFTDMSDRDLKEFIEGLTGSLMYAKAHSQAKSELSQLEGSRKTLMETKAALELNIKTTDEKIEAEKAAVKVREEERAATLHTLKVTFDHATEQAEAQRKVIETTEQNRDNNIAQYDRQIAEWETYLQTITTSISNVRAAKTEERRAMREVHEKELTDFDNRVQGLLVAHTAELRALDDKVAALDTAQKAYESQRAAERQTLHEEHLKEIAVCEGHWKTAQAKVDSFQIPAVEPALYEKVATVKAKIQTLDQRVLDMQAGIGTTCPTCNQPITEASVQQTQAAMGFEAQRAALDEELRQAEEALEARRNAVSGEESTLQHLKAQALTAQREVDTIRARQQEAMAAFDQATADGRSNDEPQRQEITQQRDTIRARHASEVAQKDSERRAMREKHAAALATIDQAEQNELATLNEDLQKGQDAVAKVRKIKDQYSRDIAQSLNDSRKALSAHERLIADTQRQMDKTQMEDLHANLKLLNSTRSGFVAQVEKLNADLASNDDEVYILQYLTTAFGISGIRSYMMDSILSYLNERLKEHCQFLFDGRVHIELSPVREQQNKKVVEQVSLVVATDGGSYDASSGGERRKVDVALFLAFRDLNRSLSPVQTNLEAYDEILSFLDSESASRVVQLLVADQSVETKILITHRSDIPIIGPHSILRAVKQIGVTSYHAA